MEDPEVGRRNHEYESAVAMLESPHFSQSSWPLALSVLIRTTSAVLEERGNALEADLCSRVGTVALRAMLGGDTLDTPLAGAALLCLLAER